MAIRFWWKMFWQSMFTIVFLSTVINRKQWRENAISSHNAVRFMAYGFSLLFHRETVHLTIYLRTQTRIVSLKALSKAKKTPTGDERPQT